MLGKIGKGQDDSGEWKETTQMSKKDKIYRERLERIRDELDAVLKCIEGLPVPMLDLARTVLEQVSKRMSSELEQKESASVAEKAERETKTDNARYLYVGPSPFATSRGATGPVMYSQYMRGDRECSGLDQLLAKKEESFSTRLLRLIDEKGMKDSDVYKRADIDRRLFSKIRGDEGYVPSKKTAISFCLALQLGLEDAEKLLATAGYTLSNSSRFDLIIMYLIEKREFDVCFANIVLDDYGEGTLSR